MSNSMRNLKLRQILERGDLDILGHGGGGGGHHGGHGHGGGRGFSGGGWGYGGGWDDDDEVLVLDALTPAEEPVKKIQVEIIGMFDFNEVQPKLNSISDNVPVSVAQALCAGGQAAINWAITTANARNLPGPTSRTNVAAALQQHATALAQIALTPIPFYPEGAQLKADVASAYRESNAVEAGAAYLDAAWQKMWSDVAAAIAKLPKEIADQVDAVMPSYLKWGLGIGAGVLVLVCGALVYSKVRR